MKLTFVFILSAIAFWSDGNLKSEALPLDNIEDADFIQDSTGEGLAITTVGSGPGVSKIIMVTYTDLLRMLKALERNVPERTLNAGSERKDESPGLSSSISIIRRDTKRCMVGRVYRPCWEV